jgi:hypothetical protein
MITQIHLEAYGRVLVPRSFRDEDLSLSFLPRFHVAAIDGDDRLKTGVVYKCAGALDILVFLSVNHGPAFDHPDVTHE